MSSELAPTSKGELRTALDDIVLKAYANGVEVANGDYVLAHDNPNVPDWEIQITEKVKAIEPSD